MSDCHKMKMKRNATKKSFTWGSRLKRSIENAGSRETLRRGNSYFAHASKVRNPTEDDGVIIL